MIVIDCDIPPSANRLWRVGRDKRVYKDPKYEKWVKQFWLHWLATRPRGFQTLRGRLGVDVFISPIRKRDADNSAKAVLDALQLVGIVDNDSQFERVTQELVDRSRAPMGCRMRITPLG